MLDTTKVLEVLEQTFEDNSVYMDVINELTERDSVEDMLTYLKDVFCYGCQSGVVTHLIYNNDIKKYFATHSDSINDILYTIQYENGTQIGLDTERYTYIETQVTWLVYEYACIDIYNFLECEFEL